MCLFDFSYLSGWEVVCLCGFDLLSLPANDVEHHFMCLLAICTSSLEKYLSTSFSIWRILTSFSCLAALPSMLKSSGESGILTLFLSLEGRVSVCHCRPWCLLWVFLWCPVSGWGRFSSIPSLLSFFFFKSLRDAEFWQMLFLPPLLSVHELNNRCTVTNHKQGWKEVTWLVTGHDAHLIHVALCGLKSSSNVCTSYNYSQSIICGNWKLNWVLGVDG